MTGAQPTDRWGSLAATKVGYARGRVLASTRDEVAKTLGCLAMLREHSLLTISAVAMQGSAAAIRLMLYPDGERLGLAKLEHAVEGGFVLLRKALGDPDLAAELMLGPTRLSA